MTSQLSYTYAAAAFLGTLNDTVIHRHHAIQCILTHKTSATVINSSERYEAKALLIRSEVSHQLIAGVEPCLLFFIEPESEWGRKLNLNFPNEITSLPQGSELCTKMSKYFANTKLDAAAVMADFFDFYQLPKAAPVQDSRLENVLTTIRENAGKKIAVSNLAAVAGVSVSRLQHLFRDATGVSIKRYMLWQRLIDGVKAAMSGLDFTMAAISVGFADGAHMSRTFKQMFGVNLSEIFRK